jgi:hypothetical protein
MQDEALEKSTDRQRPQRGPQLDNVRRDVDQLGRPQDVQRLVEPPRRPV